MSTRQPSESLTRRLRPVPTPCVVEIGAGRASLGCCDFEVALSRFEKAVAVAPESEEAIGWQIAALSRLCRAADAHAVASAGLERFTGSTSIRVAYGRLQADREYPGKALTEFDGVLTAHPESVNAIEGRIRALHRLGSYAEANEFVSQLGIGLGEDAGIQDAIAELYTDQSRYDDALACYGRVLSADPDNLLALDGRIYVLDRAARFDAAEEAARQASERLPRAAEVLIFWARIDESRGRYSEAIERTAAGLEIDPRNVAGLEQLVRLLRKSHRYAEADLAGVDACSLQPRSPGIRAESSWALFDQGRYVDSYEGFTRALDIHDRHPDSLQGKASALRRQSLYGDAEAAIRDAVHRVPHSSRLTSSGGFCLTTSVCMVRPLSISKRRFTQMAATAMRPRGELLNCLT